MSGETFKPVVFLKENCPFCLKIRIFLLEAGLSSKIETRSFVPGSDEETVIRAELQPSLEKVSFPAAHLAQGRYITESDEIVSVLARVANRDPARMPVYRDYVDGAFALAMKLWKENTELRKAVSEG